MRNRKIPKKNLIVAWTVRNTDQGSEGLGIKEVIGHRIFFSSISHIYYEYLGWNFLNKQNGDSLAFFSITAVTCLSDAYLGFLFFPDIWGAASYLRALSV